MTNDDAVTNPYVVAELAEGGISGESIADALNVSNATVSRDLSTLTDVRVDPDRKTLGKDGRERLDALNLSQTEVVNAWGACDDEAPADAYSWRETWAKAGVFILAGTVVALVIGVIGWGLVVAHGPDAPSTPPPLSVTAPPAAAETPTVGQTPTVEPPPATTATVTVQAPAPTTTVTVQPAAPTAAAPSTDNQYLAMLRERGITTQEGPDAEIRAAHTICQYRADGQTRAQLAAEVQDQNPGFTSLYGPQTVVDSVIAIYCPQYGE